MTSDMGLEAGPDSLPYFLSPACWCGKPGKKTKITLLVALFSSSVSDGTKGKESTRAVLGGKISHWLSTLESPSGGGSQEEALRVPVTNKQFLKIVRLG